MRAKAGSRVIASVARHPYISFSSCVVFILGIATGISANIAMQAEHFISGAVRAVVDGADIPLCAVMLRSLCVNLFFFLSIAVAKYIKPFFILAFFSMLAKGFLCGFAVRALLFEFGTVGILYALAFIGIPLMAVLPALLLCLGAVCGEKKETEPQTVQTGGVMRALAMLLCGVLAEGLLTPCVIQLFC